MKNQDSRHTSHTDRPGGAIHSERSVPALIRHVTMVGFWINVVLVVLKLFFGYWGHSDALVADGYHSLTDFITDLIVILFIGAAYKKADSGHPYGHGKYETFATLLIGAILLLVALYIMIEGIASVVASLRGEILPRPDIWTMVIAILSIVLKEFCYQYTVRRGRQVNSPALMANAWHHRSDAISSVATLIGVSLSYFLGAHWRIMDPVASIIIGVFIAVSAIGIAKPSLDELLEISMPADQTEKIMRIMRSVPGVIRAHNLRTRRNGRYYVVDANIHVDPDITVRTAHIIANDVEKALREQFGNEMIIYIHIEPELK